MKCDFCKKEFEENGIEESHDIPCYLFFGVKRNIRKNQADKHGRHWLCKECHLIYELELQSFLIKKAHEFHNDYFQSMEEEDDTKTTK